MTEAAALIRFLQTNLGLSRRLIIAGGFARDRLLGQKPRDIDVFMLDDGSGEPLAATSAVAAELSRHHIPFVLEPKLYATANGVPAFGPPINFQFLQWPVQIVCTPCTSVLDVVGSFDYNVCQFWLNDEFEPVGLSANHLSDLVHRNMRLMHTRTPWSSLRRGILMADRFNFTFNEADKRRLIEALHGELTA